MEFCIRMRAILAVNMKKQVVCHCAGEGPVAVAHTGIQAPQSLRCEMPVVHLSLLSLLDKSRQVPEV